MWCRQFNIFTVDTIIPLRRKIRDWLLFVGPRLTVRPRALFSILPTSHMSCGMPANDDAAVESRVTPSIESLTTASS